MRILNLDPFFLPFGAGIEKIDGFKQFMFPSGVELHVKLPTNTFFDLSPVRITTRVTSSDKLMYLLLATDALRRQGVKDVSLFLPYLPYARQDRIMVEGEPLSVKVFASIINSQNYSEVGIFDPHSDVGPALINNCRVISNKAFVHSILEDRKKNFLLVSPDAGAYKKVYKLAAALDYSNDLIICDKVRELSTGKIKSITVTGADPTEHDVFIIDDICSKGGTFVAIADQLKKRGASKVFLIVSHYEGTADVDVLSKSLDGVFTTDSMGTFNNSFITQTKLAGLDIWTTF